MLRQVSSRNHRTKGGFRAKNALQICILVAVSGWLLFQFKHSHDQRKAYEERFAVNGGQSDITRLGRKDLLPGTVWANFDSNGKEEAVDIEQDIKHEEIEDEVQRGADKVRGEEGESKERIVHEVDQNGKTLGMSEDQEQEEHSHEAREKSFQGDDASSKEVHSNIQDVGHKEHTQAARERSFEADDASSAVDHVVQLKESESESENGLFDSSKGTSSIVVHEDNLTLPHGKGTINGNADEKTEPGVEHTKLKKLPSSSRTTGEAVDNMEEQTDLDIVDHVYNETETQTHSTNEESDDQIESEVPSTDLSKSQINVQQNQTAASGDWTGTQKNQTMVVDPTINVVALQNQTSFHPLQDQNTTAKLEISGKEKSKTEDAVVVQKKSDQIARPMESE